MERDKLIQSYPWLHCNLFYRILPVSYENILDGWKDGVICAYYDGWIVLKKRKKERKIYYLINLLSLEKIRLPPMTLDDVSCILTCSPDDSSCRVLFMAEDTIWYCRPGERRYMTYKLEEDMRFSKPLVVRLEGKVYYIIGDSLSNLAVVDCAGSSFQVRKVENFPQPTPPEMGLSIGYLVESGGQLLHVCKTFSLLHPSKEALEVYSFFVFKFNFLNKTWMKVDSIGRFTIFLPRDDVPQNRGISFCATDPRIKQNSIYFLRHDDEYVHVYDLKDHSYSLLPNGLKMAISRNQEDSNWDMDYEEQNKIFLPQLPSNLSELVLARAFTLDPGAIGIIHSTCKEWGSIVRPPASEIDLRYYNFPYLVSLNNGTCKFFHPTYGHTFHIDSPELVAARIMFSKFGWLLLSRYNGQLDVDEHFFFSPFTKKTISLPNGSPFEFCAMSFSSPPTSSDCFVVGVGIAGTKLAITRHGEDRWNLLQTYPFSRRAVNRHPVFYKQKCYCLGANKKLIVIDLNTRNVLMVGKIFQTKMEELYESFLAEEKEGLLGVFLLTEKRVPHVMRMDLSRTKMVWQPVHNLVDKMVYVSPAGSWADMAPTKSTGNKIYFPLFHNLNSIFYSLSTKKYHSFLGDYSCSDSPFEARRMTNCAWINVE